MMMKWGRRQKASSDAPASHPPLISHVFPSSWFSRFKQSKNSYQHVLAKAKKKGELGVGLPSRVSSPGFHAKEGRFYGADDDSYWRLSFGDEQAEKLATGIGSMRCDLLEGNEVPVPVSYSRSPSSGTMMMGRGKSRKSCDTFCNRGQTRIVQSTKAGFLLQGSALRRKKIREGAESKRGRSKSVKVQDFEELSPRTLEKHAGCERNVEDEIAAAKEAEKVIFEVQPDRKIHPGEDFCQTMDLNSLKQCSFSLPNSKLTRIVEGYTSEAETSETEEEEEDISLPGRIFRDIKSAETNSKHEQQRKSVYINREYRRKRRKLAGRINTYSPRTAAKIECKIKALQDLKKVKMMKKKKNEREPAVTTEKRVARNTTKEKALGDTRTFESYAVIKNSLNPREDFRESMIEMILEKGIEKPEEIEELLACYLTLNCDESHDLIVKVFREVWLELNELCRLFKSQDDYVDDY